MQLNICKTCKTVGCNGKLCDECNDVGCAFANSVRFYKDEIEYNEKWLCKKCKIVTFEIPEPYQGFGKQ